MADPDTTEQSGTENESETKKKVLHQPIRPLVHILIN